MNAERIPHPIEKVIVSACTLPTDLPEADGTIGWDATTIVLVEVAAGDLQGIGYSYADLSAADYAARRLAPAALGRDPMAVAAAWDAMRRLCRNDGRPGIVAHAVSAVDVALWDLKARTLGLPLAALLGKARSAIPVYGSGGFTSYTAETLREQMRGWAELGIRAVKMKVGSDPPADPDRVATVRRAVGDDVAVFVDANGAFTRKQALAFAERVRSLGVSWFEEPVSSDDLDGLRLLRDRAPAGMDIAAGEYGYDPVDFRRMLAAGAVDVLQADATRCQGISGFMEVGALCRAYGLPLSAHTAPSLHAHACCALSNAIHLEYFHDHARIEQMLFAGTLPPTDGVLRPDPLRPGLGLELNLPEVERFRVFRQEVTA